jgi:hypothetical protein
VVAEALVVASHGTRLGHAAYGMLVCYYAIVALHEHRQHRHASASTLNRKNVLVAPTRTPTSSRLPDPACRPIRLLACRSSPRQHLAAQAQPRELHAPPPRTVRPSSARPREDDELIGRNAALYKKDKNVRRYATGVERALALWDSAQQEWADYISFLGRLLKVSVLAPLRETYNGHARAHSVVS